MSYRISTRLGDFDLDPVVSAAMDGLSREFPYAVVHVLRSKADHRLPSTLTPVFATNFDWHSSVHTHWALLRIARACPDWDRAEELISTVRSRITAEGMLAEREHLARNPSFERPYGRAWLALLAAESLSWRGQAPELAERLEPAAKENFEHLVAWLETLSYPNRSGEHGQTAFSFGLLLDAAETLGDPTFRELLERRVRDLYLSDRGASFAFEPSGHDFLSPILAEADLIRRILPASEFSEWLGRFCPDFDRIEERLPPVVVGDPTDGKLSHLDGLNLSRAWMLDRIGRALPESDGRPPQLFECARRHASAPLESLGHYSGGHWLGSFAVYLFTETLADELA